jgi:hypothetical protein
MSSSSVDLDSMDLSSEQMSHDFQLSQGAAANNGQFNSKETVIPAYSATIRPSW